MRPRSSACSTGARSPARTCRTSPARHNVIMLCLPTSQEVREVIFGESGLAGTLKPGTLIVGQTSGDPNATRPMAAELTRQGVELIDAPVSCGARGADAGTSRSWSEPRPRNTRAFSPSCRRSARTCSTSAKSSTGHTMKLVNNLLSCAQRLLTFEGTALAAKNGIAPGAAVEILTAVAEGMAT